MTKQTSMNMNRIRMYRRALVSVVLCAFHFSIASASITLDGQGTPDNPYLIGTANDWTILVNSKNSDFDGLHFALSDDITLPSKYTIDFTFNGRLDGCGHTLSFPNPASKTAFSTIGENGILENISFVIPSFSLSASGEYYGIVCAANNGRISNCNVNTQSLSISYDFLKFGIVCGENNGDISDINVTIANAVVRCRFFGGISCLTTGSIVKCTVSGELSFKQYSNNYYGYAGGIAYNNSKGAAISHCLNDLKISYSNYSSYSWSSVCYGGICGNNEGVVSFSVNKNGIATPSNSSVSVAVGGIVGNNSGEVNNCVNRGNMTTYSTSGSLGGIVGDGHKVSSVRSCVVSGVVNMNNNLSYCHAVVGWPELSKISGCYYLSQTIGDDNAIETTDFAEVVNTINISEHCKTWCVSNLRPKLLWELGECSYDLQLLAPSGIDSNSISLKVLILGDFYESGIQIRKYGTKDWTDVIPAEHKTCGIITICGLEPTTRYEVRAFAQNNDVGTVYSRTRCYYTLYEQAGTSSDPITIGSYEEFRTFVQLVNNGETLKGKTVRLTDDINMLGAEGNVWKTPIKKFEGEFDGNGHYIYNLQMEQVADSDERLGLFWMAESIHDLHLFDVHVDFTCDLPAIGAFKFGVLAGSCNYVSGCSVVGDMSMKFSSGSWNSYGAIGGMIGNAYLMDNCYALLDIETNWNYSFGGLVGSISKSIENCYFSNVKGAVESVNHSYFQKAEALISQKIKISVRLNYLVGLQNNSTCGSVTNCFYMSGSLSGTSIKGTQISEKAMTDGTLFLSLPEDDWKLETKNGKLNGGFPIIASQGPFPTDIYKDSPDVPDFGTDVVNLQDYWSESTSDELNVEPEIKESSVEDFLDIPFFSISPGGKTDITVCLKNSGAEVAGIQFDCCLPEGMTFEVDSNGNADVKLVPDRFPVRTDDFENYVTAFISRAVLIDDSRLRVMVVPNLEYDSTSAMVGTDGAVLKIKVHEAADQNLGVYYITLTDSYLVDKGGTTASLPDRDCVFYCKYSKGMEPLTNVDDLPNAVYLCDNQLQTNNKCRLSFGIRNAVPLKSLSFDVELPSDIICNASSRSRVVTVDDMFPNISACVSNTAAGLVHVVCTSQDDSFIPVGNGHLLDIEVNVGSNAPIGEVPLYEHDIRMENLSGDKYVIRSEKQMLNIRYGERPPLIRGDVNDDGTVTITDAVCIVNLILKTNSEGLNLEAADVNDDSVISIVDAVCVVNIILHTDYSSPQIQHGMTQHVSAYVSCPESVCVEDEFIQVPISFVCENGGATAAQLDLLLPDCAEFSGVTTDSRHILSTNLFDNRHLRIVCLSLNNELFSGNDTPALNLTLKVRSQFEEASVDIASAELVTQDMHTYRAEPVSIILTDDRPTAICVNEISDDTDLHYDISGRHAFGLTNGIVIDANDRKLLIP